MSKHTPAPWAVQKAEDCMGRKLDDMVRWVITADDNSLWISTGPTWDPEYAEESESNARLIAAAPTQHEEMLRYLPIIERAEADTELWERLTDGTGIATANGYRAAIAKATGE